MLCIPSPERTGSTSKSRKSPLNKTGRTDLKTMTITRVNIFRQTSWSELLQQLQGTICSLSCYKLLHNLTRFIHNSEIFQTAIKWSGIRGPLYLVSNDYIFVLYKGSPCVSLPYHIVHPRHPLLHNPRSTPGNH